MAKSLSKQDRQGVRTPTNLEQKYRFGNEQKNTADMKASFTRTVSDMMAQMASIVSRLAVLEQRHTLAAVVNTEGVYSLVDVVYTDLKAAWDAGGFITLYIDQSDGSRRYYHCMGSGVSGAVSGLVFQYGYGTAVEYIFLGEDGSVTVSAVTLAVQTTTTEGV